MGEVDKTLDQIADEVRSHLSGAVENIIKAGQALQRGRSKHKSDKAFHEWCKQEFPDLHRNTRLQLMQIGRRFSAHQSVQHNFTVLRELAAPSVPDELVDDFMSSEEPVKVKDVKQAREGYKQLREDPDLNDVVQDLEAGRKTPREAAQEAYNRTEEKRERINNSVAPNVVDLGAIAKDKSNTDIRKVGPAFIALMETLCTKFDRRDIERELVGFMEPDPLGLKTEALHKMADILDDLRNEHPLTKLKNLN